MERRCDPYLSEDLIKLLAETNDIDDNSDDTDGDITYQPSCKDCKSSDSECDLGKAITEKRPVNLINCGHGDVLCYPSTLNKVDYKQWKCEEADVY